MPAYSATLSKVKCVCGNWKTAVVFGKASMRSLVHVRDGGGDSVALMKFHLIVKIPFYHANPY